ncbi:mechanosensitive ion channel family protein [Effusibacillus dendaii]|uniref:Mechanosensitive ion channel protein MscS n=1 Tax=Effusibacillus dendaii TaxID=2743772 RepID=A0A7I8DBX6_9BACL|nr:mechanosensitive ion channel family protein [Effusibacillus dendaii]BCJ87497.1 mechanosensitive ion channel protein MscS [Effusibacillus dendaii]
MWIRDVYAKWTSYLNAHDNIWIEVGVTIFKIVLILILARVSVAILKFGVEKIFRKRDHLKISQRRSETAKSLMKNTATYVIYFVALLTVLQQIGVNLGPVLAGAGVVGLAVGFGAQSLVKDVISGFFLVFEDWYSVGDMIEVSGKYMGTVVEIGLRITKIKGMNGEVFIIPNGNITEVTNYSVGNSIAIVDVGVAYEEEISEVTGALTEILKEAEQEIADIVKTPEILGVQNLSPNEVIFRISAECRPTKHWSVGRQLRARIKTGLDRKGIEIAYPRLVTLPSRDRQEKKINREQGQSMQ